MDTSELKKLLKGSTAVLILENGEPSFVILGYDAYKDLLSGQEKEIKINHGSRPPRQETVTPNGIADDQKFQHQLGEKESELLERINNQILALKDEITKEEKSTEIAGVD